MFLLQKDWGCKSLILFPLKKLFESFGSSFEITFMKRINLNETFSSHRKK